MEPHPALTDTFRCIVHEATNISGLMDQAIATAQTAAQTMDATGDEERNKDMRRVAGLYSVALRALRCIIDRGGAEDQGGEGPEAQNVRGRASRQPEREPIIRTHDRARSRSPRRPRASAHANMVDPSRRRRSLSPSPFIPHTPRTPPPPYSEFISVSNGAGGFGLTEDQAGVAQRRGRLDEVRRRHLAGLEEALP